MDIHALEVIGIIQNVCEKCLTVEVSHGWWERFHYHPNISLRTTAALMYIFQGNYIRLRESVYILEDTLDDYKLRDRSTQIFNLDETGMLLNPAPLKGVCEKGAKSPVSIISGDKS